jgi:chemosensory pili system protein ChpA (sensor histidine kinase/response regulator)
MSESTQHIHLSEKSTLIQENLAEAQLMEELRAMFEVDSQQYLQSYINLVQELQAESWKADIQEIYRSIHTIKGGSVTVGADAILQVATVLEDLLSDLRYLETAPPLEDGYLRGILLEAGELLTASLQIQATGEKAVAAVQSSTDRIIILRQDIKSVYLPEANERSQLFQEFAEQGFDLVILELDMALEQLPERGQVPPLSLSTAKQTLQQLIQIGKDLEFEQGWFKLLRRSQILLNNLDTRFWKANWPLYLRLLKDCAKKGGKIPQQLLQKSSTPSLNRDAIRRLESVTNNISEKDKQTNVTPEIISTPKDNKNLLENIQIPVALERLDRSAQYLVEILLAARSSQGYYQNLQSQLIQLIGLAQDTTRYISHLRQLQDDYALLNSVKEEKNSLNTPNLERYRQGYTTINQLLEISLRLSELGAEATTTTRQTTESFYHLDRHILNLQRTIEESRLISFKNLGFRAKGILRELSNRFGKPVQLLIQGEQLELDVGTVQTLEPALLHLLRNAFDHALESPDERIAKRKPQQGNILLSLERQGNFYLLKIQDDGRGIDANLIAKLARNKGLPLINTSTPKDLLAVICQPGFSSQNQVSEVSGRGVGMDVVANQIKTLGGYLSLETQVGLGTTFILQIPVPQLLLRCVLVKVEERIFAIPTDRITTTTLWSNLATIAANQTDLKYSWLVKEDTNLVPAVDLFDYWQTSNSRRSLGETAVCFYIRSFTLNSQEKQQKIWLIADDLLEQSELLISPLPNPLISPPGLMGVSLQKDGKLIPVIDPNSLIIQFLRQSSPTEQSQLRSEQKDRGIDFKATKSDLGNETILVVDDAALVRRRIESSLTHYGYTVQTCRDGLEAWNWIQNHRHPALMITDIEMPVMDGFTLIDRLRKNGVNFPILVVSSRLSEEWDKEAKRLGANGYLTKGFTTPELIDIVEHYISESKKDR